MPHVQMEDQLVEQSAEVHVDRKLGRMFAILPRLNELRRPTELDLIRFARQFPLG